MSTTRENAVAEREVTHFVLTSYLAAIAFRTLSLLFFCILSSLSSLSLSLPLFSSLSFSVPIFICVALDMDEN